MDQSGDGKKPLKESGGEGDKRWVCKMEVWHVRGKKMIRRHDGKPFRFPIKGKKKG
jgi:hypothetical protein